MTYEVWIQDLSGGVLLPPKSTKCAVCTQNRYAISNSSKSNNACIIDSIGDLENSTMDINHEIQI